MSDDDSSPSSPAPLSPGLLAAIQEAIAAGFAGLQPLAPPAAPSPLVVQTTPKLGLKKPDYTELADIMVLNGNMDTLDNSITADVAATLTNKTLVAPVITNPTITGWTNAQHTHLDAAGAGALNGAAIVSGDIGTGFLARESYVNGQITLALTGGGADLVTPDLIDPVVRDTLWWGPAPTGAPDVSLKRLAANSLQLFNDISLTRIGPSWARWSGAPLPALDLRSTTAGVTTSAKLMTTGDDAMVAWNVRRVGAVWMRDDVTKRSALLVEEATSPLILYGSPPGTAGLPDDPLTWSALFRVEYDGNATLASPTGAFGAGLAARATGSTGPARFGQGDATLAGYVSVNARYDGTNWLRDDVTKTAAHLSMASTAALSEFAVYNAPVAANPIAWTKRLSINNAGNVGIGSDPPASWAPGFRVIHLGQSGVLWAGAANVGAAFADNTFYDGTNFRSLVPGPASYIAPGSGQFGVYTADSVATANATQTLFPRLILDNNGTVSITPRAGYGAVLGGGTFSTTGSSAGYQFAGRDGAGTFLWYAQGGVAYFYDAVKTLNRLNIYANGSVAFSPDAGVAAIIASGAISSPANLELTAGAGASVVFTAPSTYIYPINNGIINNGHPSSRWLTVYAATGAINTSVYSAKEGFTPLDPGACAEAVLETDWVAFAYRPPAYVEADPPPEAKYDASDSNEVKAEKKEARDAAEAKNRTAHAKAMAETAFARQQKGYVLQSPDHHVHDLFGLEDRESASVNSDLAVVACALQGVLRRLAALETASPTSTRKAS